jgi:DNA-binding NtrC family response regulator
MAITTYSLATPDEARGQQGEWVKAVAPHVLVVDDERLIRWSVAETRTPRGMKVSQASDGASAMRLLESEGEDFDVVLLDLRLPDVSDLSLVAKARELAPQSRVVIMTAFGTPEVTVRAIELGVSRIIRKPFEMDDLGALVDAAVMSKRAREADD